jgi:ubiquitin carboxyl-terminal hydrolase 5/13
VGATGGGVFLSLSFASDDVGASVKRMKMDESAAASEAGAGAEGGTGETEGATLAAAVVRVDGAGVVVDTWPVAWSGQVDEASTARVTTDGCSLSTEAVQGVLARVCAMGRAATAAATAAALGIGMDEKQVSPVAANLVQIPAHKQIPPKGWMCEVDGCSIDTGLWLSLGDGFVGCGREVWGVPDSGKGHALSHYESSPETGCIVVKMGTICPDLEKIDVYSYAEDDMVIDPKLEEHLAHWGIGVSSMRASEATMAEAELEANLNFEASVIQAHGSAVDPAPLCLGLANMGNSCYLNSVMQALAPTAAFRRHYAAEPFHTEALRRVISSNGRTPTLNSELAKVGYHLVHEAANPAPDEAAAPRDLKAVIGADHVEFASGRQQDALEFYSYLLSLIERADQASPLTSGVPAPGPMRRSLLFTVEERVQCTVTNAVAYKRREENSYLYLPIPHDGVPKGGHVPFSACVEAWAGAEAVDDYVSAAAGGAKVVALRTERIVTAPDVLVIALRRFEAVAGSWEAPKKLDICVDVDPEAIFDLESLRGGKGLQEGETAQPELDEAAAAAAAGPQADPMIVSALEAMGFPTARCERAALAVNNGSADAAAAWLFEHMDDPEPPTAPAGAGGASSVNPDSLAMLTSMGFTETHATAALRATDGDVQRATDWIFSHPDPGSEPAPGASAPEKPQPVDGPARYRLVSFVSHIGSNTGSGHYVAHRRNPARPDQWLIFNDSVVAACDTLPIDRAYMLFFERIA